MRITNSNKDFCAINQFKFAIVLLLLFVLSSCSSSTTPATPRNQPVPKETATQTPTSPTKTPTPTSTFTPTLSLKEIAQADFLKNSIDLTPATFESVILDGSIVFSDSQTDNYFFYDMKNKKIVDIGKSHEETITDLEVSPNKKLMLVSICPKGICDHILRTVDKILKTNLATEDDWALARWLDNERFVFLPQIKPGQPLQPQHEVIYNVFTGEKSNLQLYLPNPETIGKSGGPDNMFQASLAPSLKRVIFTDRNNRLVLWNLDTQKEMAALPRALGVSEFGSNGWSPDGKKFVTISPYDFIDPFGRGIMAANELFIFDMDGNLTQLTHYNEKVPFVSIHKPSWSPDNRRIAFWLTIGDDATDPQHLQERLAIFDTSTFEARLYRSASRAPSTSLVWSPDGQQLIIHVWKTDLTLVDLAHETESSIPDTQNMWALDWMAP